MSMKQVRCPTCGPGAPRNGCSDCRGSGYVRVPNKCKHPNEEYEAMTGGWVCPDCGESGPL